MSSYQPPAEAIETFHEYYKGDKDNLPAAMRALRNKGYSPVEVIVILMRELNLSLVDARYIYDTKFIQS